MLLCSIHAIVLFFMPYALGAAPSLRRAGKVSRLTCGTKKHSCRRSSSCTDVITGRPFAGDAAPGKNYTIKSAKWSDSYRLRGFGLAAPPLAQRAFVTLQSLPIVVINAGLAATLAALPWLRLAGRLGLGVRGRMAGTFRHHRVHSGGTAWSGKRCLNSASSASASAARPSRRSSRIFSPHFSGGSAAY